MKDCPEKDEKEPDPPVKMEPKKAETKPQVIGEGFGRIRYTIPFMMSLNPYKNCADLPDIRRSTNQWIPRYKRFY